MEAQHPNVALGCYVFWGEEPVESWHWRNERAKKQALAASPAGRAPARAGTAERKSVFTQLREALEENASLRAEVSRLSARPAEGTTWEDVKAAANVTTDDLPVSAISREDQQANERRALTGEWLDPIAERNYNVRPEES